MVEGDQALPDQITLKSDSLTTSGANENPPTNTMSLAIYDRNGFTTTGAAVTEQALGTGDNQFPGRTATKRRLAVAITPGSTAATRVAQVVLTIPSFTTPDQRVDSKDSANMSEEVKHTITIQEAAPASTPKVVSIQRLRPGSQTVVAAFQEAAVSGPFDVRIVLTEAHPQLEDGASDDELRKDRLVVEGGEPSSLVIGVPFARFAQNAGTNTDDTIIPNPIEGMYAHAGDGALQGVPPGVVGSGNVPLPSGDDGMYRQYRVTITPYARSTEVKISVKSFNDGESPRPLCLHACRCSEQAERT